MTISFLCIYLTNSILLQNNQYFNGRIRYKSYVIFKGLPQYKFKV